MQVNQSMRTLNAMPPDRQTVVRRAFQDLRGVPIDQRQTMLNSARYNATFLPRRRPRRSIQSAKSGEPYQEPMISGSFSALIKMI